MKSVVCELKTVLTIGVLALFASASPTLGAATGLIVIPTAETLPGGEYVIEPGANGPIDDGGENNYLLGTEFGIGGNLEAGVDYDFSQGAEQRTIFNAKYVFKLSSKRGLRGGIGIDSLSAGLRAKPYVALTWRSSTHFGFHTGVFDLVNDCSWFFGADYSPSSMLTFMADHTFGSENLSSVGFFYRLTDWVGIQMGMLIPNSGFDPTYSLLISFSGKYAK